MCGEAMPYGCLLDPVSGILDPLYLQRTSGVTVVVSGRRWGKSRYSQADAQREFDDHYRTALDIFDDDRFRAEYYGDFTPDDRPIADVIHDHFRDRIAGRDRSHDDDRRSLRFRTAL